MILEGFWVQDDVFYGFAFVGVGDVDFAVFGLDDGGVGEAGFVFLSFEGEDGGPVVAVFGYGDVEHGAVVGEGGAFGGVVVDEELAAVFEGDGVGAGAWVGEVGGGHLAPGFAAVFGPTLGDDVLAAAAEYLQGFVGVGEDAGLDCAEFDAVVDGADDFPGFSEVGGTFEVDAPALVFGPGGAE